MMHFIYVNRSKLRRWHEMEWNGARVGVGALHARLGIVIKVVQIHTALGVLSAK